MSSSGKVFDAFSKDLESNKEIKELPEEENMETLQRFHTEYVDFNNPSANNITKKVLKPMWDKSLLKIRHKQLADIANFNSLNKIENEILRGKFQIPEKPHGTCEELVELYKNKNYNQIQEELINKHRLQDVKRMKQELKDKLMTVETDIQILNDQKKQKQRQKSKEVTPKIDIKEHKQLVHKLRHENESLEKKRQEKILKMQQELEKEKLQKIEEEKQEIEKKRLQKKQLLEQNIKKLQEQQENRHKMQAESQERFKQIQKTTPLFVKKEELYKQQTSKALLEKKQALTELRKLQTPKMEDLKHHITQYNTIRTEKEQTRYSDQQSHNKMLKSYFKKPSYENPLYNVILQEEMAEQEKQRQREEERQKIIENLKQFNGKVRQEYKPKVDQRKVKVVDKSHDVNSSNIFIQPKSTKNNKELIDIGNNYMKANKARAKQLTKEEREQYYKQNSEIMSNASNIQPSHKQTTQSLQSPNYLSEKYKSMDVADIQLQKMENLRRKYENKSKTNRNNQNDTRENKSDIQNNQIQDNNSQYSSQMSPLRKSLNGNRVDNSKIKIKCNYLDNFDETQGDLLVDIAILGPNGYVKDRKGEVCEFQQDNVYDNDKSDNRCHIDITHIVETSAQRMQRKDPRNFQDYVITFLFSVEYSNPDDHNGQSEGIYGWYGHPLFNKYGQLNTGKFSKNIFQHEDGKTPEVPLNLEGYPQNQSILNFQIGVVGDVRDYSSVKRQRNIPEYNSKQTVIKRMITDIDKVLPHKQIKKQRQKYMNSSFQEAKSQSTTNLHLKGKEQMELKLISQKLSDQANKREELMKKGGKDDPEQREKVANLYLSSIKAKLQLLNNGTPDNGAYKF